MHCPWVGQFTPGIHPETIHPGTIYPALYFAFTIDLKIITRGELSLGRTIYIGNSPETIHPALYFAFYYRSCDNIRVKKLAALAFILVADVIPAFESLSSQFLQDEHPLLAYFEKTWIGTPVGATRRLTPDFLIQMWNALERSAAGSTPTTNALEAYHHAFNALISCQHPSVRNSWTP